MIFNYKRFSSFEQNTARQPRNVPYERECVDKDSGKNTQKAELQAFLMNIHARNVINVHFSDRWARNFNILKRSK